MLSQKGRTSGLRNVFLRLRQGECYLRRLTSLVDWRIREWCLWRFVNYIYIDVNRKEEL